MSQPSAADRGTGSTRHFDSLFATHHEAVFKYCARRLGRMEAEDAVADVFAITWRRLDAVPPGDASRAWLIAVAYKVVGNRFRSRRRRNRLAQRLLSEQAAIRHISDSPDVDTRLIHQALDELSRTDRELIRLSSWDGMSRREIAQVLGISVNAVDQRLHRARSRLKVHFDRVSSRAKSSRPEEASI